MVSTSVMQTEFVSKVMPWTWSASRRAGYGLLAIVPLALLLALVTVGTLGAVANSSFLLFEALPVLAYTHVTAQFITLLIFGHLLMRNPQLERRQKLTWGAAFLFAAPFSVPTYWLLHVLRAPSRLPAESREVESARHIHVYEYDYTPKKRRGTRRRADGVVVHRVPA